jgi:hypothetical protein
VHLFHKSKTSVVQKSFPSLSLPAMATSIFYIDTTGDRPLIRHVHNVNFGIEVYDLISEPFLAPTDKLTMYGEGNGQRLAFVPLQAHTRLREITAALTWYAGHTKNTALSITTIDPRPPGLRVVD